MRKHYDFSKGKRNVHAKRLGKGLLDGDIKRLEKDPEYRKLCARMDVAGNICEAMGWGRVTIAACAKRAGITVKRLRSILAGDANLGLNEMVQIFDSLGCRFDLVVTSRSLNEWDVKRAISRMRITAKKTTGRRPTTKG